MRTAYNSAGENTKFELWVAGAMSPLAKKNLEAAGVVITEHVSSKVGFVD